MSRIRGTRTTPELILRTSLWRLGLRMGLNRATPHGRADLVSVSRRLSVFVDGCFWHGCPDHYVRPRSRCRFWAEKLRSNVERDRRQTLALEGLGWKVVRVWEHDVESDASGVAATVLRQLTSSAARTRGDDWRVVRVHPLNRAGTRERWTLLELRDPKRIRTSLRNRGPRRDARHG